MTHLIIKERVDLWGKGAALNEVLFYTSLHLKTSTKHWRLVWLKFREGIHSVSSRKITEDGVFRVTTAVGKKRRE